jgi:hypothetical protein
VVRSPRSRGKGNRRWPGRPGGVRKRRPIADWRRRCQHLVSPYFIPKPHHFGLFFRGEWGNRKKRRPEYMAYRLDQEMARLGIPYWKTLIEVVFGRSFFIIVSQAHARQVEEFIARVERRRPVPIAPPAPVLDRTDDPAEPTATELA